MNLRDAIEDLKKFVRMKTTQQPAFLGVILDALDAAEELDLYHGDAIRCYFEGDTLKELPKYVTEIAFETEEEQKEFEDHIKSMIKYRWHDLRKDPADLPEQEGTVLVSLNGKLGSVSYVHAVESRYYIPGDEPFYGDPYMNGLVEAWKEIEPFEDGKDVKEKSV